MEEDVRKTESKIEKQERGIGRNGIDFWNRLELAKSCRTTRL